MNCFNIIECLHQIKRVMAAYVDGRALLVLGLVAWAANCTEDSQTIVPRTYDYSGTYVALSAVEIYDDDTEYQYNSSNISGLMVIEDSSYVLEVGFYIDGTGYLGRSDIGSLSFGEGYLEFNTAIDSVQQKTIRGSYDLDREEIKISYLSNSALWTEIWKRATLVEDSDTNIVLPF